MTAVWADKRPILMDFWGNAGVRSAINPRGYAGDATFDPSNASAFRALMLAYFNDYVFPACTAMDAQGVIVWDLPGAEFPHVFQYTGAPELLSVLAPEMDAIADDLFAAFAARGLIVGTTLRPQWFGYGTSLPSLSGLDPATDPDYWQAFVRTDLVYPHRLWLTDNSLGGWYDASTQNSNNYGFQRFLKRGLDETAVYNLLNSRITYCKARWPNMKLFYVDSNVYEWGETATLPASIFAALHSAHPSVLIIPEWQYHTSPSDTYYTGTAPYEQLNIGQGPTPPSVYSVLPDAMTVCNFNGLDANGYRAFKRSLIFRQLEGRQICMANWYEDTQKPRILEVMAAAETLAGAGVRYGLPPAPHFVARRRAG